MKITTKSNSQQVLLRWCFSSLVGMIAIMLMACPAPIIQRSIQTSWVGTPKARLTGYFARDPDHNETVPGQVPHDTVLDEATLSLTTADATCVDVVVRSWAGEDEPLDQLRPVFKIGEREEAAIAEGETVAVHDYSVMGSREVFSLEGVSVGAFLGLSLNEPEEQVFRVIERRGRYCCSLTANAPVGLELQNERMTFMNTKYRLRFKWTAR